MIEPNIVQTNIDIKDIITCKNRNDIDLLLLKQMSIKNKTIFIDKYDKLCSDELNRFIMSGQNRIMINSRVRCKDLGLNAESILVIKYNKDRRIYYSQNVLDIDKNEYTNLL